MQPLIGLIQSSKWFVFFAGLIAGYLLASPITLIFICFIGALLLNPKFRHILWSKRAMSFIHKSLVVPYEFFFLKKTQKTFITVYISPKNLKAIEAYCEWSKVHNLSTFVEQSANLIFEKDGDWNKWLKTGDNYASKSKTKSLITENSVN